MILLCFATFFFLNCCGSYLKIRLTPKVNQLKMYNDFLKVLVKSIEWFMRYFAKRHGHTQPHKHEQKQYVPAINFQQWVMKQTQNKYGLSYHMFS